MKIVDITEGNIDEFADEMDEDISESIGRKYYRAKGILDGEDVLGTMIWEYREESDSSDRLAELMWLSLADDTDAKELFLAFDEELKAEDVKSSFFEFVNPSENVSGTLVKQKYDIRKRESRDIYTTVGDVAKLSLAQKKPPSYIVRLYDLTVRQYRQGVISCLYKHRKGMMEDLAVMPMGWYDQDISCAVRTDDEITGFFLVHRYPSGILAPVLLYAVGPNSKLDLINMMRFTIRSAAEEYDPDTKILIRRHNPSVKALSAKLLPELKGEVAMFGEREE